MLPEQVVLERDAMMYELRKRGMTYEQIGKAMKVSTKTAHNGVKRMTERILKRMTDDYAGQAALDLERLDSMLNSIWDLTRRRQIETPDGETVEIPPSMDAIDRVLRIMDRRAKLLGLDAAKLVEVNVSQQVQITAETESLPERSKRHETIELLKVMRDAGVLEEAAIDTVLSSIQQIKEPEAIDVEVLEIEAPTEPPAWTGEEDEPWQ